MPGPTSISYDKFQLPGTNVDDALGHYCIFPKSLKNMLKLHFLQKKSQSDCAI